MKVKIKFFAALREGIGKSEIEINIPSGSRLNGLIERLEKEYKAIAEFKTSIAYSINMEYVRGDEVLKEGDEIALIPPVSGGCPMMSL
ncbi:MAG: molybdopterin converting factor subunit 1 [Candidatus Schekmanbacteria bacterium RIFCSPHIGHO2_02_FULL_38_11]|uniref:Molybdopterin synthase sulfur carrier subunit n=1 Tax=Candidatus Schekmanbacteria bacterium RIFCSPLOWO2_12_FULL_38_15 TaxID=1817883 RepID=A0A1F7SDH5_9BACT|nr:MAG: molybdopterin converting factor subunit 1 [Candidatus Schekmanbacteria bacterium GWA2_38_9]OGL49583.1 MAG: molybdopterin converting factor subunit 1 [Candidatus Schekmanbacteria bacterium RIFCSPHIGHO2_02_FULL_38_11]OGL51475.1 MAG: molybdopterin converting factor subunit 1 [Candidatus Schekmanbacteria bacterium RIFCSPLOWO2_02_FULL_38_14]OGL51825.1 MAG: molybdopterin converting factor subunit 1 [Candidatus Schekmanbacteria bacterium RIFCSPLOWO2_12_FULL_38_15]